MEAFKAERDSNLLLIAGYSFQCLNCHSLKSKNSQHSRHCTPIFATDLAFIPPCSAERSNMKGSGWVVISCSGQVPVPSVAPPVLGPAETQPPLTISAAPEPRRSAPPSRSQAGRAERWCWPGRCSTSPPSHNTQLESQPSQHHHRFYSTLDQLPPAPCAPTLILGVTYCT